MGTQLLSANYKANGATYQRALKANFNKIQVERVGGVKYLLPEYQFSRNNKSYKPTVAFVQNIALILLTETIDNKEITHTVIIPMTLHEFSISDLSDETYTKYISQTAKILDNNTSRFTYDKEYIVTSLSILATDVKSDIEKELLNEMIKKAPKVDTYKEYKSLVISSIKELGNPQISKGFVLDILKVGKQYNEYIQIACNILTALQIELEAKGYLKGLDDGIH